MAVKTAFNQVMNPFGTWSALVQYKAEVVYGGVSNTPLYVSCPVVKSTDGLLYYTTGYNNTTGVQQQPTLGVTPQTEPTTWTVLTAGDGTGSVTSVSIVSANGLAGSVATATTTPAITLSTSITGILQGNGTAISAATTVGAGRVALSPTDVSYTPTISVTTPGDLNIVYNQQSGTLRVIGKMAYLSFYVAATMTYTTATGTFSITGLPAISPADEMTCTMDVFLKSTTIFTAGYTSYVAYMDGSGATIQILPQSTNPALNPAPSGTLDVTDFDSGTLFKFRGMLVFPII